MRPLGQMEVGQAVKGGVSLSPGPGLAPVEQEWVRVRPQLGQRGEGAGGGVKSGLSLSQAVK